MVFIGLISTSLKPLSPTSWLPSTPQPFPCRVRAKRVVVAVPKKSLMTIILVRSPSNFIFTQFGCLLTAPKRKKLKIPNFIFLTKWGGCPPLNGHYCGAKIRNEFTLPLPKNLSLLVRGNSQMARAARRVIENLREMIKSCPVLHCSSHRKTESN